MSLQPSSLITPSNDVEEMRNKYGDFFVILFDCGEKEGYYTPIELSIIQPFNFVMSIELMSDITQYIAPIYEINADTILVSHIKKAPSLIERMTFINSNYPLMSAYEDLSLFNKQFKKDIFNALCKQINRDYIQSGKDKNVDPPINENYTLNSITGDINDVIIRDSKIKNIPDRVTTNPLEYVSFVKLNLPFDSQLNAIILPTMIPYIKSVFLPVINSSVDVIIQTKDIIQKAVEDEKLITVNNLPPGPARDANLFKNLFWKNVKLSLELLAIESYRAIEEKVSDLTADYVSIFTLDQMGNLYTINKSNKDSKEDNKKRAYDNLIRYFGSKDILNKLDLSKTYVTGSALSFALSSDSDIDKYLNMVQQDDSVKNITDPADPTINPFFKIDMTKPSYVPLAQRKGNYVFDPSKGIILNVDTKTTMPAKPGADIDLMVDERVSDNEFTTIAEKHYLVFKTIWPNCRLERTVTSKDDKQHIKFTINSNWNDYLKNSFRQVEIYKGSIRHIISHHVPVTRAWYGFSGRNNVKTNSIDDKDSKIEQELSQFYLDADCIKAQWLKIIDNYHYFAGKKSLPLTIIGKYDYRGYNFRPKNINLLVNYMDIIDYDNVFRHIIQKKSSSIKPILPSLPRLF